MEIKNPDLYNKDELNPPEWMNGDFFEMVLQQNVDFSKIINYKVGPATVKGDHYASIMFRGIIQYFDLKGNKQEISLIIKTMPVVEGTKMDLLNDEPIFETEIEMFRDVIPKFEEKLKSIGDNTKLGARMLYSSLSPRKVIVLEDACKLGYSSFGQQSRMCTLNETQLALDTLAKWHACSIVLNQELNGKLERYNYGAYTMPLIEKAPLFTKGTERLAKVAKTTPQLQKYAEKLEQVKDLVFKRTRNIYDTCRSKANINCLSHGDFHVKNLLFQFDPVTKIANKILLCDFQLCVWGSVALDLIYSIYMISSADTRKNHQEELFYNYFKKFQDILRKLNYNGKIPTFSDFQKDLLLAKKVEFYLAVTFLPFMVKLQEHPNTDFDEIMTKEEVQLKLYESKKLIDELEVELERFLYRGYFEDILLGDN